MRFRPRFAVLAVPLAVCVTVVACSSSTKNSGFEGDGGEPDAGESDAILDNPDSHLIVTPDGGPKKDGGPLVEAPDPVTCAEAQSTKSYLGCDYWPTITPNPVWSVFDFAVVVANTGKNVAQVTVTGAQGANETASVPPGELRKIYLPWVPALKGPDTNECGNAPDIGGSVIVPNGAFHLVSSVPVVVYQFNALEYKGQGGKPGKDWSQCPGSAKACGMGGPIGCFSFSNDAALLLPSTVMTKNYRVTGIRGDTHKGFDPFFDPDVKVSSGYIAITATQDATAVNLGLSTTATVLAGGSVSAANPGSTLKITLAKAGDVALIVSTKGKESDLSGSVVNSDKPVQVISGSPCLNMPDQASAACDHVEQSVFPAETLGKRYVITTPTRPIGTLGTHVVRFYGNVNGTTLTYDPAKPAGCPATLNAGQVVECGPVNSDFQVTGNNEFAVNGFMLGATELGAGETRGDPSETVFPSIEQFRSHYMFLAPDDYSVSYVDIVSETGVTVQLDGVLVSAPFTAIGNSGYGVRRVKLGGGVGGAHTIVGSAPVGAQVIGYGDYTSYQYPAGLNLNLIAAPPPPPK